MSNTMLANRMPEDYTFNELVSLVSPYMDETDGLTSAEFMWDRITDDFSYLPDSVIEKMQDIFWSNYDMG